jgi:hypothetical protein
MPRAVTHFKHAENFTDVGNKKWLCNICKADVMSVKQAIAHEVSVQHSSNAEVYSLQVASSSGNNPTFGALSTRRVAEHEHGHWTDLSPRIVGFWRKGLEAAERGEEAESMHEFLDRLEEELAEENRQGGWPSSPVGGWGWGTPAEDWTPAADVWASGWGKPVPAKGPPNARHKHRRREGHSSTTSMHREVERNGNGDDVPFVENFLRCHGVDPNRRERMRSFYEMPTDQKIQKIEEVIRDLRGQ